ncbi:hypothetical protein OS493_018428 [Desmophyllum pertusum]|uniref:G-protein coupled receptors family 1 profile domain-containing protein n=1 Tax=Desmophyllum pertusum TaxID=174260 RepID=A0A9X0A1I4_9CNID|nr:hypothetical protein OS493_018428 [Desmophyllum pertusum]
MSFNSTRLSGDSWCLILTFYNHDVSNNTSPYYQITLVVCIITSLLAPLTVAANALILAAIWRNPSLRTPSYVLLAGLAFTDFSTGLLCQPVFVVYKLAELAGNRKLFCIAGVVTESVALFLVSLTGVVITMIAVERWLHMSRRSLLTVRRVVILYITFVLLLILGVAGRIFSLLYSVKAVSALKVIFLLAAASCVVVTAFSYFKVFRIIRRHQCQVQASQNSINMEKYKKSIFTILYFLVIFVLSYVPYLCCILVFYILQGDRRSLMAAFKVCLAVVFSSSFFNTVLYYWRIKEIRGQCKKYRKEKLFCKGNGQEL